MKKKLNQFKETTRVETKVTKDNYEKEVSSILETLKKRDNEIKELKAKIERYSRDQKKKKYRLRGRSSETAKAHRG
eukprot:TRINITY_DN501_c0_g1_i1.p2 TRINITY_DN501_c0_g1~~TRINITY_DN501_c0_g1_i1.p2  ORF type:complete len:76 (+),score=49.03 TRINITY_DN501_c0_g1_i1:233-460(+)